MVDRNGRLFRFTIKPGNAAESPLLLELIDGVQTNELIADGAYDSNVIRNRLAAKGIVSTIPPRRNRRTQISFNRMSYRARHRVENLFADLKQYRGVATRYCKLLGHFTSFVQLAWWAIDSGRSTD